MPSVVFTKEIEVRYSETDAMAVVYHANYLGWFDVARIHLLDQIGYPYTRCEDEGYFCPVVHAELDYRIPFRFGEKAIVHVAIKRLSAVKCTYAYKVYAPEDDPTTDKPRISGSTVHCIVDSTTFKPCSMKKQVPELYSKYQSILEEDF